MAEQTTAMAQMAPTQTMTLSLTRQRILTPGESESLRIQAHGIALDELAKAQSKRKRDDAPPVDLETIKSTAYRKLLMAAELELPPVVAATQHLHDIQGTLTLSATLMRAMWLRSGVVLFEIRENTPERCVLYVERLDRPGIGGEEVWDMDRAQRTGTCMNYGKLKDNWRNYSDDMLLARATSSANKKWCADITGGLLAPADFGFSDREAQDLGMQDPLAPIGEDEAKRLIGKLRAIPDHADALDKLKAYKAEQFGSPEYKLAAVPDEHAEALEAFIDGLVAEAGSRIGVRRADQVRAIATQALVKAGWAESDAADYIREYRESCKAETLADLSTAEADELGRLVQAAVRPEPEPEFAGEVVPEPERATPLFPDGGDTPPTKWRSICAEHGIDGNAQAALQAQCFGKVRPAQDPDEMGRLVAATQAAIDAGGVADGTLFGGGAR